MKICVTKKVRELLPKLDEAFQKFHNQTEVLAGNNISHSTALDIGAEREAQKRAILGIAWQINKASRKEI